MNNSSTTTTANTTTIQNALTPGLYRHYKGMEYRVFGLVRHSETEEQLVHYQALYGEYGHWVRPLEMFIESVEVDGKTQPRFALVKADQ